MTQRIEVLTPDCIVCGDATMLRLENDLYLRWLNGELVQDIWPAKTAGEREVMITGTHPVCWEAMFPPEDDT